jgi:hypothetical protein
MFGFPHRYEQLVENRDKLVLYSIGYCLGEELSFRQKPGHFAVLFEYDGTEWWNHFTEKEFVQIFC